MPDALPKNSENANKRPVTPASRLRTGFGARKASIAGGHAEPPDGYCRTPNQRFPDFFVNMSGRNLMVHCRTIERYSSSEIPAGNVRVYSLTSRFAAA